MRIGIDITPLQTGHKTRGIGFYTRNLTDALQKYFPEDEYILFKNGDSVPNIDVLHYPYFDFYFKTLPFLKKKPTVVTIHDVIPLVFKGHYPPGIKGELKFALQRLSLKNTSSVICDSQNSKKDIVKYLGYPEDKIHVVYLAAAEIFAQIKDKKMLEEVRKTYALPENFVLYVGDVNWNKNIPGLVEAFSNLKVKVSNLKLVLVGEAAKNEELQETKELICQIKKLGSEDRVLRLGFVPDEDLVGIYSLATVYIQPSLYEGFGLPVLEAMACGCPVVCSNTSSLPEIAGDAAVYTNPESIESLVGGVKIVLDKSESERQAMIKKGLEQAKKFSWEKTAKETLGVYKRVTQAI